MAPSQFERLRNLLPDTWLTRLMVSIGDTRVDLEPGETLHEAVLRCQNGSGEPTGGHQAGQLDRVICDTDAKTYEHSVRFVFADPTAPDREPARRAGESLICYPPTFREQVSCPGYAQIRQVIGTDWMPMVAVTALVVNDTGQVLLQKRSDDHTWATPGGAVECGEDLEAAVGRELWEETGLTGVPTSLVTIRSGPPCAHTYPHGDQVWFVGFVYEMKITGGEMIHESEETVDLRWFDLKNLPPDMHAYNRLCALDLLHRGSDLVVA